MSFLDKQYVTLSGHDFTPYVHNQDDLDVFNKLLEHEEKCIDVPAEDCIEDIMAFLNLARQLQGIEKEVIYIGKQNPQLN